MKLCVSKKYEYEIFGLHIISEIFLTEVKVSNNQDIVHVTIQYGHMPEDVSRDIDKGIYYKFEKNKMWFAVEDVAKYYISDGRDIIVEPSLNSDKEVIKTYLLGSAFGMLLMQRDLVAFHGGTVLIDGKGVIITGDSGAGKSTLISLFRQKGCYFMADDISVIRKENDDVYHVYSAYPQQKLCSVVMNKMGYDTKLFKKIAIPRHHYDKYAIPVHNSFVQVPKSISAVCEIVVANCENVEIHEIKGVDKMALCLKNIYGIKVMEDYGLHAEYFKKCLGIAQNIPFLRVTRPIGKFSVEEQARIIEKRLTEINV